jgi:hypothetical protein
MAAHIAYRRVNYASTWGPRHYTGYRIRIGKIAAFDKKEV